MVQERMILPNINQMPAHRLVGEKFEVGFWAAGYERRSSWLIQSKYRPTHVKRWYRVEFEEHRDTLHAPRALQVKVGELLGKQAGKRYWDGYWRDLWNRTFEEHFSIVKRPLKVFIDYSSMPRTVYGTFFLEALRESKEN